MRNRRRLKPFPCLWVAAPLLALVTTASLAAPEAQAGKRDLRAARAAIDEGSWEKALSLYELILESALGEDPTIRSEALYSTSLLLLAVPERPDTPAAGQGLAALDSALARDHALEVRALSRLLATLADEEARNRELRRELAATAKAQEAATDEMSARSAAELAEAESAIERQRDKNRTLRQRNRSLAAANKILSQRLEDGAVELALRQADLDFLIGQLEGSQQDQQQMLDAVMKKNEELKGKEVELRAIRIALQEKEAALEGQAEALSEQEEELKKREEAIREVTDRVLNKEQPDR